MKTTKNSGLFFITLFAQRGAYDLSINTALLTLLTSRVFSGHMCSPQRSRLDKIILDYLVSVSTMFDLSPLILDRRVRRAGFAW